MAAKQPFEAIDFSRGMTDHIHDQEPGIVSELVNFLVTRDKKPISRPGSRVDDSVNPEIPTGLRVSALVNYANSDKLFYQSVRSLFFRNPSAFTELVGPSGNGAYSDGDSNSVPSFAQWNRHLYLTNNSFCKPMKVYKDGSDVYQIRNSSLPAVTTPTVTAGAVGTFSYLYGFYYAYTYQVFGLTYEAIGPVTLVQLENAMDPVTAPIQITNMPVIANGSGDNYDTANIKLKIFRTEADQTFLQQVTEVTNGTTSYSDSKSDTVLAATGISLYTNDGTVDADPVPLHKYNHVVNNCGYYAHIKDSNGEISPYKFRQSIPTIPDSAPIDFEGEVDDEITGINSVRSQPIIFCKRYIFRVEGSFDRFGRGGMNPVRISDHAGCVSNNSVVTCENGMFWFGNDGVYYSDGYAVNKVTDHLNDTYKSFLKNTTNLERIIGKYFERERLIVWAIQTNSATLENDSFFICDLGWGISNEMTFMLWQGTSFKPSALEVFNKEIFRGSPEGFTIVHDDKLRSDPKINIYKPVDDWVKETIRWKIKTIHYNFGGTFFRKLPTRILLSASDNGNTTIQITAINDEGRVTRQCRPIRHRGDFVWGDDDFVWRDSDFVWRGQGLIEQWRRFPKGGLRLSTLQLVIENGFSDVTNSDFLGSATFNGTTNKVTLNDSDSKWPLNSEDYFIALENDGYVKEYLITGRDSDQVLSINDPVNTLATGSMKWVMRGYKKDEALHLLGFNIHWNNVSKSQKTFENLPSETGENA